MRGTGVLVAALALLGACAKGPELAESATYGPDPQLQAPRQDGSVPSFNVPKFVGWPEGAAPTAPAGFAVTRYAEHLRHPRWLYLLPNGDVLVAESSSEPAPVHDVMTWGYNELQRRGGSSGVSANRITLLQDSDGDGDVDAQSVLVENLNQPFGMVYLNNYLYVANTDSVVRFPYALGATHIEAQPERITDLPFNTADNGHWTRNIAANADGSKLYVTVGSVTNVGEQGPQVDEGRAAIYEMNPDGSGKRVFASGLRNPNGLAWEPVSGRLWTTVNERDSLGPDLVPDYMTGVNDGDFFGWPWSYWGNHADPRFEAGQAPADRIAAARKPDYALGAHTASLGLAFYTGAALPARYRGGAFIGQHGSWNRVPNPSGYKVLFVPFANGQPSGMPEVFLDGFLNARGEAQGRPVGVAIDRTGAVLVADDSADMIWRVAPAAP